MSPRTVVSPKEMAAEMRRKAETAQGADRDYFLWLASEWGRTAEREAVGLNGRSVQERPSLARA